MAFHSLFGSARKSTASRNPARHALRSFVLILRQLGTLVSRLPCLVSAALSTNCSFSVGYPKHTESPPGSVYDIENFMTTCLVCVTFAVTDEEGKKTQVASLPGSPQAGWQGSLSGGSRLSGSKSQNGTATLQASIALPVYGAVANA